MTILALQLYSIKDEMEQNVETTLERVAAMGYEGVEFAGYYGRTATEIKAKLDELNLKVVGSHIMYEQIFNNLEAVIAFEKEIGNSLIICPYANFETENEWVEFTQKLNEAGEKLSEEGLQLAYHNHNHEFEVMNGQYILEIMMENTKASNLQFEIDTYWTEFADVNTIEFLTKHQDRIVLIHLKDMRADKKESTQVGDGRLNIASFIAHAPQAKAYVVEQEAFELEPIKAVEKSCQYLNALLG